MSKIYTSADQLIGHTPLLELTHIEKEADLKATVLAKLEYFRRLCQGSHCQEDDRRCRGHRQAEARFRDH